MQIPIEKIFEEIGRLHIENLQLRTDLSEALNKLQEKQEPAALRTSA